MSQLWAEDAPMSARRRSNPASALAEVARSRWALGRWMRMRFISNLLGRPPSAGPVGEEPGCVWRLVLPRTVRAGAAVGVTRRWTCPVESPGRALARRWRGDRLGVPR